MEVVASVAVLLALYWAYSAKRNSQISLRYELHKETALAWGIPGEKIDLAEAKATIANARVAG